MIESRANFLLRALSVDDDDCVIWPFAVRSSSGYGAHSGLVEGRKINWDAHAYVCIEAHGARPSPKHQAAHSCGNKLCVNPRHLRWATAAENLADAIGHGRMRGGGRYRQRLFAEDVRLIRASDQSLGDLARQFGMEPAYIGKVRRGECHLHV